MSQPDPLHDFHAGPEQRFYGPSAFQVVFDRFDLGAGDRFYDDPRAYEGNWEDSLKVVRASLLIISASKGAFGRVDFVIERYDPEANTWQRGAQQSLTYQDLRRMITLIP